MTQDELKRSVALAALAYIEPGTVLGIGTGSTTNHFIDALADHRDKIDGVVVSSEASSTRIKRLGIPIYDLNGVDISIYVDGADECNEHFELIKGGGGALTREKIIAACAKKFVCIADDSKMVQQLGAFPLPIEVIPMARSYVARQCVLLGGNPVYRANTLTDNGNQILDVWGLPMSNPMELEGTINQITGVVTCGLFARRPADVLLIGTKNGIKTLTR